MRNFKNPLCACLALLLCAATSPLLAGQVPAPSPAHLPRVMSLNLCADPYLMAFAEKTQIIALTPQSHDSALSPFTEQAKNFPVSDGQIENIAALKPDLVIVSSYSDPMRNRLIAQLGINIIRLDAANGYAAARDEIMKLGQAIGRSGAAQDYIAQLDQQLATAQKITQKAESAPRILPLQRRNLTVGDGHILDEIITRSGAVNLGRQKAQGLMGRISLEQALTAKADYILVNETGEKADSRGMEFLTHPALKAAYPANRHLRLNNNLLVCAGATTPLAVARLTHLMTGLIERKTSTHRLNRPAQ